MSPDLFVLTWLAHGTLLGFALLLLPRLFRVRDPRRLTWWWASSATGVVMCPLLPIVGPGAAPAVPAPMVAFVETTTFALAPALPGGAVPSPLIVLGLVWGLGVVARLAWLAAGHRRLSRLVDSASVVVDDPALEHARRLVPPRGRQFPLAAVPVSVLASATAAPCAFGWRRVRVLVPQALRDQPEGQRVAVYLHELLHAARGDVYRAYGDEAWRLLCWWQPAVWWMLARLRLAREHEVDAEVVARTGGTRDYVEALLWCSTLRPALSVGPHAGGHRHALVRRVTLMCGRGEDMSRTRRWITNGAMVLVASGITASLGLFAPLRAAAALQDEKRQPTGPGPLERVAVQPTLDAPVPRRVVAVEPAWSGTDGHRFRVHLVIDTTGRVAEARTVGRYVGENPPIRSEIAPAEAAALEAVRQWQFEAPVAAPLLVATDVNVGRVALSPATTTSTQAPLRVGAGIAPPKKVLDVPPVYPDAARQAAVSGVVVIEATIDAAGLVQDAKVLRGVPQLDEAALAAVKQWRYAPTWLNGEPVPVVMTVTINFSLE